MKNPLDELNLTNQEKRLLVHLVGLCVPEAEPKGYWGRFLRVPLNALRPREALWTWIIVAIMTTLFCYSFWKWPIVVDLLGFGGLVMVLISLTVLQDRSSRLIRKLYRALESAKVPGP
jgi:hypothetical protein